jgi:putative transposase
LTASSQARCVAGRGVDGSPRLHAARQRHGSRCGRQRVARLLRAPGRCATRPHRHKPLTTASPPSQPVAPHLLARPFPASGPHPKGVADITAMATRSGGLDLAGLRDVSARRAIGDAIDTPRDARLVAAALDLALASRQPAAGLLHHCDRGSPYTRHAYRALVACHGIVLSMSGQGAP